MFRPLFVLRAVLPLIFALLPLAGHAQDLNINNGVQTYATLNNTVATLSGRAELHVTGTGDPIPGCTIHLNSPDAWLFLEGIQPSTVVSTFLSRVRVNGAVAAADSNVRVVQYAMGAVVIPHGPAFAPMEVFEGASFTGASRQLRSYVAYGSAALGSLSQSISSFRLKRGYTATLAENDDGTGASRNYVAQDGDLEVGILPANLDNKTRFIRIFPWRWVSKKGIAGNIASGLNVRWDYNWNLDRNSTRDIEYVPIRQTRWWPGLNQDWKARGSSHLLGYNEPDQTSQANLAVGDAIWSWPDLLGTGLRVGAPAVSDGGLNWLYSFMSQADAAGLRVDFVPVHYYRSYSNAADPNGAATQFYNFLKGVYDVVKRPLWVTEWNNGANWTSGPDPTFAQQQATVAAMITMLDNTPFVERYAIYNWVEDVRRVKWDDGSLTAAGVSYRDKASPIGYVQEIPDPGTPADAYYSFNGDARDGVGNGHNVMLVGAPTFTAGKYGQAIAFNGTSDYLQVSPRVGDSSDFTFSGWIKWNGGSSWQRIFDFGQGTGNYFFLSPRTSSGNLRFAIKNGGSEQQLNAAALATGVWTHVAVTISGDTGKLFVNGALVATNTAMTINPGDVAARLNFIGKSQFSADPLFSGQMDDLRFLSTALTDAQVAAIAANPPPQFSASVITTGAALAGVQYKQSIAGFVSGGVGAKTFTKVAGPSWLSVAPNGALSGVPHSADRGRNRFVVRVRDANGAPGVAALEITVSELQGLVGRWSFNNSLKAEVGGLNGTAGGSVGFTSGVSAAALDLNGTNAFVTLPPDVGSEEEVTVAMWFRSDSTASWQRLFDFGSGTSEYMFLTPRSGSNTLRFAIKNGEAEQTMESPSQPLSQWVHVAVSIGGGTGRLYVNGALAATQAISIRPTDFAHELNFIGKSQFADPLFDGQIDEFLVFNRVLDGPHIAALASASKRAPAFTSDLIAMPSATANQIYEQSIATNATDPNAGTTLTFAKVSGPTWLSVAPDGRISGVPPATDAGTNRFVVRVTDETLLADEAALTIAVPSPTGLRAQYQFEGNTADNLGGAAGVAAGGPVYEAGLFDRAIRLDGIDDSVQLPSGIVSGLSDFTIAARIRWDGGGNWQRLFDFGTGTSAYLFLTPRSGGGTLQFGIKNGTTQHQLNGPALTAGDWAHVAVTLTGTTGTLYLNGTSVATGAISLTPGSIAPTLNYLGKSQFSADPLFNGTIDDFRIYSRGLSAAEIASLAVAPAAVPVTDSSYAAWRTAMNLPPEQSDVLADPDNDGLDNAWEYIFGSDPRNSASVAGPVVRKQSAASLGLAGNKTYLTLQARVRQRRLGAMLIAEAAPGADGLSLPGAAAHAKQAGASTPDGEFEIITYYYDVPVEDSPTGNGALRLRVSWP